MASLLSWAAAELECPRLAGRRNLCHFGLKPPRLLQSHRGAVSMPCRAVAAAPAAAPATDALSVGASAPDAWINKTKSSAAAANSGPGSDRSGTLSALDVPPSARLGPRIEHVIVPRDGQVADVIAEQLHLPKEFAAGLVRFGAVHYCPIHPLPADKLRDSGPAGQQHFERAAAARAAAAARHGKDPRLSVPRRLTDASAPVHEHGYMRVHVHPKRFPAAYTVSWKDCIILDAEEFVVLNKPPGVQVTPTVDNVLECCLVLCAKAIGRAEPLLVSHRLDTCTEGILVLGKTKSFVSRFNALLTVPGAMQKMYRGLTATPLAPGVLVDHVLIQQRAEGGAAYTQVLDAEQPGSLRCELEVLSVQQVTLTGEARQRWGRCAYEHLIELRTGRTHQGVAEPPEQGRRDVMEGIGLQACQLDVHDASGLMGPPPVSFAAADPWWRS